ncbi:putative pyruvate, phosphate dikinase regulatory protein [Lentilactobacillus parabuchneri]|uniref:Putative pyruvate, phosphate dikinase regulatory protein n=3 Tax=Lentilactobacillus parabuchneri TaxID=152331 RepID=A0A1X1FBX3_9LACO|nr:pyruvate, water dikinase regulatory protein [Lentilactobacillus parabuchneri]APR08579.1 Putative pyruvate, phosphate dikinase regulatory protein [Lentilactobacillus parabuchneri]KRM47762.1 phosphotransferase ydiA [Lentilactobacillus parabuchneri DSM 5707 = NBRC 107865]KRN80217.1 phosphotransferase ydiA [Lentilactobacillus parabuchneri]MBW0221835.1 kinase/pyrophosphorylase [Lentilactobacillus parabuchneri]MBW0244941.1 kinase/pyrophosphorylase [Lentilactobacillus parabuchneri]
MKTQNIFIISDSSGATAQTIAQTALSQFPDVKAEIRRFPFIQTESILKGILKIALANHAMIFHTLVSIELSKMVRDFCKENGIYDFDCVQTPMRMLAEVTGQQPAHVPGLIHDLNQNYFERISAIEFAVENDDGKNPKGLLEADIVLLGVSRTSKTPLSLYLANQNQRVANLPIGPDLQLPEEVDQIDKDKMFGLLNTPEKLSKIRKQRMISYGLNADTPYSDPKHIKTELEYAKKLYRKIGCLTINVANKSIEETATIILESLNLDTTEFED